MSVIARMCSIIIIHDDYVLIIANNFDFLCFMRVCILFVLFVFCSSTVCPLLRLYLEWKWVFFFFYRTHRRTKKNNGSKIEAKHTSQHTERDNERLKTNDGNVLNYDECEWADCLSGSCKMIGCYKIVCVRSLELIIMVSGFYFVQLLWVLAVLYGCSTVCYCCLLSIWWN